MSNVPDFRGRMPTAAEWRAVNAAAYRNAGLRAGPGLAVVERGGSPSIERAAGNFRAKVTGGSNPYTWNRGRPTPGGGWSDDGVGGTNAYEYNGSTSVPSGAIVELERVFANEWRFVEPRVGSGVGVVSCTPCPIPAATTLTLYRYVASVTASGGRLVVCWSDAATFGLTFNAGSPPPFSVSGGPLSPGFHYSGCVPFYYVAADGHGGCAVTKTVYGRYFLVCRNTSPTKTQLISITFADNIGTDDGAAACAAFDPSGSSLGTISTQGVQAQTWGTQAQCTPYSLREQQTVFDGVSAFLLTSDLWVYQ